jgi:hypothetical protein
MTAIDDIKTEHRFRQQAMKQQQKMDRALESFVRINATDWTWDADEKQREKFNREVKAIIAAAREGKGDQRIVELVLTVDKGRQPFDELRDGCEKRMEQLAASLPVAGWIEGIRGAGLLGLATIIAETGDLSNYPNPAKVWKRLGFAPYDGLAGSTWKRTSWRPRALTADEWIANPFSGHRYALMHQIAIWLVNAQWISAKKAGGDEGKPNGPYGEVYAARRAHTAKTHPDWSKGHSRMDGIRVAMKAFLKDLHIEWRKRAADEVAVAKDELKPTASLRPRAPGQARVDAQRTSAGRAPTNKTVARGRVKPKARVRPSARPASVLLMPKKTLPGAPLPHDNDAAQ